MASSVKPMHATASAWTSLAAFLLALRGHRRTAGALLVLLGGGYVGVVLERTIEDDLRRIRTVRREDLDAWQWLVHSALAVVGYRLLTGRKV